jgi:hypothetical protein
MGLFGYGRYKPVVQLHRYLTGLRLPANLEYTPNQTPYLLLGIRDDLQARLVLMGGTSWVVTFIEGGPNDLPQFHADQTVAPVGEPFEQLMRKVVALAPRQ